MLIITNLCPPALWQTSDFPCGGPASTALTAKTVRISAGTTMATARYLRCLNTCPPGCGLLGQLGHEDVRRIRWRATLTFVNASAALPECIGRSVVGVRKWTDVGAGR